MVTINHRFLYGGGFLTIDLEIDCGILAKDTAGTKRVYKETQAVMSYTLGPTRFSGPPPQMSPIMEVYCDVVTTIQASCSERTLYLPEPFRLGC